VKRPCKFFSLCIPMTPGGFTEKGMRIYLQQTAPRLGVDPDKVAMFQVADVRFLREAQEEVGIQCRDGYGCQSP
jgi:hypothetical protein